MAIYEEIGGAAAVGAAVDGFYDKVLSDEVLAPYFEGVDVVRLKSHQRMFIGAALGGPNVYMGQAMGPAHARLGVTSEAFDTVVGHLVATLEELGVPGPTIEAIGAQLLPLKAEIVTSAPIVS